MTGGKIPDGDLAASMALALLPPRFPARRDLELEAAVSPDAATVSAFDYFWRGTQVLAVTAIRIHQPGLPGAWTASGARALLRALLGRIDDLAEALAALAAHLDGIALDGALFELDLMSGRFRTAMHGEAAVRGIGGTEPFSGEHLEQGAVVWVTAGEIAAIAEEKVPEGGLDALVHGAIGASRGGAGMAVLYKSTGRLANAVTLSMANDLAAIPQLLDEVERFLRRRGVDEATVEGLDVAFDEVLTNVVNYGYRDGNAHEILVALDHAPGMLTIEIRDDGVPFDPLSVPEPDLSADIEHRQVGGLGMFFVRSLLDSLAYKRSNGWNVLTLEKRLPEAEAE